VSASEVKGVSSRGGLLTKVFGALLVSLMAFEVVLAWTSQGAYEGVRRLVSVVLAPSIILVSVAYFLKVRRYATTSWPHGFLFCMAVAGMLSLGLSLFGAAVFHSNSTCRSEACRSSLNEIWRELKEYRRASGSLPSSLRHMVPKTLGKPASGMYPIHSCYEGQSQSQLTMAQKLTRAVVTRGSLPNTRSTLEALLEELDLQNVPGRIYVPPRDAPTPDDVLIRDGPHLIYGLAHDYRGVHWLLADGRLESIRSGFPIGSLRSLRRDWWDMGGWTRLHVVVYEGAEDGIRRELAAGEDVNARSDAGWTPLHCAALTNDGQTVALLLEAGADKHARDRDGTTPEAVAEAWGHEDLLNLLTLPVTEHTLPASENGRNEEN